MLRGARIAVVVPAFNEERWIEGTIRSMPAYVDNVIVVDDASRDRTASAATDAGAATKAGAATDAGAATKTGAATDAGAVTKTGTATDAGAAMPAREPPRATRVVVIVHPQNRGVGAAIATGYRRALELGADVVAVMAGDGQMHPDDLEAVVAPVIAGETDYAKGDRLQHPSVRRTMPLERRLGTAALAWLTQRAAGLSALADSQCGFTAISAGALRAIDIDALWPRYGYPNDLIGALARAGMRVRDVPVRPVYRGEASGLRPWHLLTIGYLIARIAYRRANDAARASTSPSEKSRN